MVVSGCGSHIYEIYLSLDGRRHDSMKSKKGKATEASDDELPSSQIEGHVLFQGHSFLKIETQIMAFLQKRHTLPDFCDKIILRCFLSKDIKRLR